MTADYQVAMTDGERVAVKVALSVGDSDTWSELSRVGDTVGMKVVSMVATTDVAEAES